MRETRGVGDEGERRPGRIATVCPSHIREAAMNVVGKTTDTSGTTQDTGGSQLYKYGFWVVNIGIAAILVAFLISLVRLSASGDVATVASAMFAAIGTLAGAYFGYHAGSGGKTAADQARQTAEDA